MKNIKIASHHHSLASAVEAAKPDLSYNEPEARRRVRDIDLNCRKAIVTEDGDIYYIHSCDIEVLNKFEPFVSCLDNCPFRLAFIVGDLLSIGEPSVPKTKKGRDFLRLANETYGALAA